MEKNNPNFFFINLGENITISKGKGYERKMIYKDYRVGNVKCFKWNVIYIIHNIFYYIIECYLSFVKVSMIGEQH